LPKKRTGTADSVHRGKHPREEVRALIADAENHKKKLEEEHPLLTAQGLCPNDAGSPQEPLMLTAEAARVAPSNPRSRY